MRLSHMCNTSFSFGHDISLQPWHDIALHPGNIMSVFFVRFERTARYLFSIVAALVLFGMLASQMGWIRQQAAYDAFGWYTVIQHDKVQVVRQVDNEAACRSREEAPRVLCRQGKALNSMLVAGR
ncbi:hypothetical protein [Noviherbaspirillum pedocola]|uniref:Uncharacterized protein n=1 Tax=Noviherbaspirillum pedocola TaxID=2801341 RepID=A0A934W5D5_9BURK|nr:hypothetical protein [Noviherbaspirillum pedocola]MBK4734832.1 hypothetical protein [Noviherbaspirillum pedocola]